MVTLWCLENNRRWAGVRLDKVARFHSWKKHMISNVWGDLCTPFLVFCSLSKIFCMFYHWISCNPVPVSHPCVPLM